MGMLILLCGLGAGALLLRKGWLAHRVGNAFHCRACEFDLSGVYPGADRCPECGSALESYLSVVTGRRERRWKLLWAGTACLLISAAVGTLSAKGLISVDRLVSVLPTHTLIAWSIDRPESPIAGDGRSQLLKRVRAGLLNAEQQSALFASLESALARAHALHVDRFGRLMSELGASARSAPEIRAECAAFLAARHDDDRLPWVRDWGPALVRLRDDGLIPDAQWQHYVTEACAPRLWRTGAGTLRAGGEFIVGLDFRGTGLTHAPGMNIIELVLPGGAEFVSELVGHAHWQPGVTSQGLPGSSGPLRGLVRAPARPGTYEIKVRVWYSPTQGDLRLFGRDRQAAYSNTVAFEDVLTIEVVEAAPAAPATIADWLRAHVLPPHWSGSESGAPGYRGFGMSIPIAAPGGPFAADGELVAVEPTGERVRIGNFFVSAGGGGASGRFRGVNGGSSGSASLGGRGIPRIDLELDATFAPPLSQARLMLLFHEVTLPDGRTHHDAEPIEVELETAGLRWRTPW